MCVGERPTYLLFLDMKNNIPISECPALSRTHILWIWLKNDIQLKTLHHTNDNTSISLFLLSTN